MPKTVLSGGTFLPPTECLDGALVSFSATSKEQGLCGLEAQREKGRLASKGQLVESP